MTVTIKDIARETGKSITTVSRALNDYDDVSAKTKESEFMAGAGNTATTVHQPIYQIGSMVCEMLLDTLPGKELDQRHVLLKPTLIVRQSCGSNHSENGATVAIPEKEVLYT